MPLLASVRLCLQRNVSLSLSLCLPLPLYLLMMCDDTSTTYQSVRKRRELLTICINIPTVLASSPDRAYIIWSSTFASEMRVGKIRCNRDNNKRCVGVWLCCDSWRRESGEAEGRHRSKRGREGTHQQLLGEHTYLPTTFSYCTGCNCNAGNV